MATISENLQTIKSSMSAIKQAISDKGGDVSGDISTWASAISGISGGGGSSGESEYTFTGTISYNMTEVTITGSLNKVPDNGANYILALGRNPGGLYYASYHISNTGTYTLTVDFEEPLMGNEIPALCILKNASGSSYNYSVIPVKFQRSTSTDPT